MFFPKTKGVTFGLTERGSFKVGRSTFNYCADNSVSRSHAEITIQNGVNVMVKDLGSKFGTYVGERAIVSSQNNSQEDRLIKGQECQLTVSNRVRFGLLSSLFKLEKLRLVFCTSSLTVGEAENVKQLVSQLPGARLVGRWSDEITHLVVSQEGTMTIKVANALGKCLPVTTSTFLTDLQNCIQSQQVLPDPSNYLPMLKEVNPQDCSLAINPNRKQVFANKRLLFSSQEQLVKYKIAIQYAGGKAQLYQDQSLVKDSDVLVASTTSNRSQSLAWNRAVEQFEEWDMLPVQEMQIALAILHASCQTYCNPLKKYRVLAGTPSTTTNTQRQSQFPMLASPSCTHSSTQATPSQSFTDHQKVIPETIPPGSSVVASMLEKSIEDSKNARDLDKDINDMFDFEEEASPTVAKRKRSEDDAHDLTKPAKKKDLKESPLAVTAKPILDDSSVDPQNVWNLKTEELEDINNIFNFEDEAPTPAKRKKRSEDSNELTTPVNCKRADSKDTANSGLKMTDEAKSLTDECQSLTLSSSRSMVVEPTFSRNSKSTTASMISSSQFLCKRRMKLDESERSKILGDIPQNELSKSFVKIEKKSLVVERGRQANQRHQEQNTVNKNVKKFRKQRLVKSTMSIIRATNSSRLCTIANTNNSDIVTPVEELAQLAQVNPPQENDVDANLWNFDQSQSMM